MFAPLFSWFRKSLLRRNVRFQIGFYGCGRMKCHFGRITAESGGMPSIQDESLLNPAYDSAFCSLHMIKSAFLRQK
ncbi:hypothetical protein D1B31_12070 [Neobacillus notoginsengisoli]|uniref:Uncharacterized protein n=1 Tax=Neobacillus notoginsengisoli TaxID=1578198 RepID=A0A417YT98_9BACI|nr:hypothetical protein D1B31_12070 [Neobacillus notoginsengisoli]